MKSYVEPGDVARMEATASCMRDRLLIRLPFRLGCRISEALGIEAERIDTDRIERLSLRHLAALPYKSSLCRYHSFVVYFSNLVRLGWVEFTGHEAPSAFQDHYAEGQPRRHYRLTPAGYAASDRAWANPRLALYGG